jgi:hypothetical protein
MKTMCLLSGSRDWLKWRVECNPRISAAIEELKRFFIFICAEDQRRLGGTHAHDSLCRKQPAPTRANGGPSVTLLGATGFIPKWTGTDDERRIGAKILETHLWFYNCRYYFGSPVWFTPQAAPQPHRFHQSAVGRAGEDFLQDALP